MPPKAPAHWYWCKGELLQIDSLSPGSVRTVISGNHLGHLPFSCFTCCYHSSFLVANNSHQTDKQQIPICTLQRKSRSVFMERETEKEGAARACPELPRKPVAYRQIYWDLKKERIGKEKGKRKELQPLCTSVYVALHPISPHVSYLDDYTWQEWWPLLLHQWHLYQNCYIFWMALNVIHGRDMTLVPMAEKTSLAEAEKCPAAV